MQAVFHYENLDTAFVFVSIWNTIPFMHEGGLGGAFGKGQFFFLNSALNFVKHLDRAGGHLAPRGKKGIEKGGGKTQWTNLADFIALPGVYSGLEYELGSL